MRNTKRDTANLPEVINGPSIVQKSPVAGTWHRTTNTMAIDLPNALESKRSFSQNAEVRILMVSPLGVAKVVRFRAPFHRRRDGL